MTYCSKFAKLPDKPLNAFLAIMHAAVIYDMTLHYTNNGFIESAINWGVGHQWSYTLPSLSDLLRLWCPRTPTTGLSRLSCNMAEK